VNFERKVVTFRPSAWRRLKAATSHRSVPLVPQLEAILRAYLSERTAREVLGNEPTRTLLFPAMGPNGEAWSPTSARCWTGPQSGPDSLSR
jgi:hypothetical protein